MLLPTSVARLRTARTMIPATLSAATTATPAQTAIWTVSEAALVVPGGADAVAAVV